MSCLYLSLPHLCLQSGTTPIQFSIFLLHCSEWFINSFPLCECFLQWNLTTISLVFQLEETLIIPISGWIKLTVSMCFFNAIISLSSLVRFTSISLLSMSNLATFLFNSSFSEVRISLFCKCFVHWNWLNSRQRIAHHPVERSWNTSEPFWVTLIHQSYLSPFYSNLLPFFRKRVISYGGFFLILPLLPIDDQSPHSEYPLI